MQIEVEGNIGSGKTYFLKKFREYLDLKNIKGFTFYPEPIETWTNICGENLLFNYTRDPKTYSFEMQVLILTSLFLQRNRTQNQSTCSVYERSIYSANQVFQAFLFNSNKLTNTQKMLQWCLKDCGLRNGLQNPPKRL